MKKNVKKNLYKLLSMFVAFLMMLTLVTPKAALAGSTPPENGEAMEGVLWVHKVLQGNDGKEIQKDMVFEIEVTGENYKETHEISIGKPLKIEGLKYGEYKVVELNAEDYHVTMMPENGMVTVGEKEAKLTIWNKEKEEVVVHDGMLTINKILKDSEGNVITAPHTFKVKVTGPSYPEGKYIEVVNGIPKVLEDLKYGTYTVMEKDSDGYIVKMDPENGKVKIGEGMPGVVTIWNKEEVEEVEDNGVLHIHKYLLNSWGKPIAEAREFTIKVTGPSYPNGEEFTVKSGEMFTIEGLKYGEYTIVELDVDGYVVTMYPKNGVVTVGATPVALKIYNKEKPVVVDRGMLTIHKYLKDSEGNLITEPMTFEIEVTGPSFPEGKTYEITNGTPLVLNNLKYGKYTVVETAVEGYETTMWPANGEVWVGMYKPGVLKIWNMEEEIEDVDNDGVINIHKYLLNSWGKPIAEAREFTIKITGPSYPNGEEFTVKSGEMFTIDGLLYGEYTIVELDADGYVVTMYPKNGVVTVGATPVALKIWNKEKMVVEDMGMLTIHKYLKDSEGNLITTPMTFEIEVTGPSFPEGKTYEIVNGTPLVLHHLKYGKYTVEEVAVEGYETTMWPVNGEVWVGMHRPGTVKIWNMEEEVEEVDNGVLWIHKYLMNSWGRPIEEGKEFTIKVTGPSYPSGQEFTVMSGDKLMIDGLKYGEYTIVELDADGYVVTMYPKNGVVTVGATPVALKIWNKEKMVVEDMGMLTIHKFLKDSDGNLITEPMKFEVHVTGPSYPEGKHFDIYNGTPLVLHHLKYGKYTVEEVAVEGYETTMWPANGEVWVGMHRPGTVKIWNMEEEVEEVDDNGVLWIHKILRGKSSEEHKNGVEFTIKVTGPSYPAGHTFKVMSGKPYELMNLKHGEYLVEELVDVDDYEVSMKIENGVHVDDTKTKVQIDEKETKLTIWNREKHEDMDKDMGMLTIHKYLKDSEGNIITMPKKFEVHVTGPSYPEGKHFEIMSGTPLVLHHLKYGKYTVEEVAVEGYETTMDPANGEVWVRWNKPATVKIWNMEEEVEDVMGQLIIRKVLLDNMGKPIHDVREFKIWVKGPSYPEWEEFTVKNGTDLTIGNLMLGQYEVREVGAEDNYKVKIGEILPLTVGHRSHVVTVTNMEKALGQLTIHKILKDEDGDVITAAKYFKIWVKGPSFPKGREFTVKNGTPLVLKNLIYGTYTVSEPGAHDDYKVSIVQSPKLTITAKMGTATITNREIEVEEVSPLPQTGGVSSSALYLMSSMMILGGLGLLRKKED